MTELSIALGNALQLIAAGDAVLLGIVSLSLSVSISAVLLASLIGLPLGAVLGMYRFRGRRAVIIIVNALMGLPPVVVGLAVYLLLSRSGVFGDWALLFSPTAMVIAQCILVTPILTALTRQIVEDLWAELGEQLQALNVTCWQAICTVLWEGRFSLLTALLAGLGRALAEVGAIIIVGGNIAHVTRTMTTTIALQTSQGELSLALGLGIVLLLLALLINAGMYLSARWARPKLA